MPQFAYKAINDRGATIQGVVEAESVAAAQNILAGQGLFPTSVGKARGDGGSGGMAGGLFAKKVGTPELLLFTKQIRTMIRAGISITQVLEILEAQTENATLRQTLRAMTTDIKEGATLTDAFRRHPKVFNSLYCSLIHAGELSGTLPEILERITFILDHEHKVREDVKSALAYPKMVVFALGGAFFFLLTFVIPKFAGVFASAGLELPAPTRLCIWLYQVLKAYWPVLIGAATAAFFALRAFFATPQGAFLRDHTVLRLPVLGPLFVKTAMSRFSSILSILMKSGVSILDAIRIISAAIGNAAIAREFDRLKHLMEEGRGIAGPLREAKFFTPMVINMIAVGEESGSLEDMLQEVSHHYDEEVGYATKALSDVIGPVLVVGLTAVVGFFALAIFLPMWDLTKMAK
ncbi:MAG: type II secretion system F family protein [Thermodesulfobacteriota bacterium]